MIRPTRVGIIVFALAILLGPLYTAEEYSIISNSVSELGAQHTPNNFIMICAFITFGVGIVLDGVKRFQFPLLPFILFGLAMAIVGVFPHKPVDSSQSFNAIYHNLHGILASIAGTAITVGFIWQGFRTHGRQRIICFYMALIATIFPILMLSIPNYKGIIQRVMYVNILAWLWLKYPVILTNKTLHKNFHK